MKNIYPIDKYGAIFDAHIHTYFDFHDGFITPRELIKCTKRKKFNWVLAMSHDTARGSTIIKRLAKEEGLPCISGIEVSTIYNHFLAYGLQEWPYLRDTLKPEEAIEFLREQDCAIFLSHPYVSPRGKENPNGNWTPELVKRLDIDGIEWINGTTYFFNGKTHKIFKNFPRGRRIAGTDAHHASCFGWAFTQVDVNSEDPDDLVAAMKKGKCIPYGNNVPLISTLYQALLSGIKNKLLKHRKIEGKHVIADGDRPGSIILHEPMNPTKWREDFINNAEIIERNINWVS